MDEDADEGGFRFGVASEDEDGSGPEPRVPEYSGDATIGAQLADEPADPDRLEPGTPSLENVVFVLLGVLATLAAFAQMFPFL